MCDTLRCSCFLPVVFLSQDVKSLALNLCILSLFMLSMDIFPSGCKCGTHMNVFSMFEQVEKQSLFSLHLTQWPVGLHRWPVLECNKAGVHDWLWWQNEWVLQRKGTLSRLLLEFTLAVIANERFVRQGVVEVLHRGNFSYLWLSFYLLWILQFVLAW